MTFEWSFVPPVAGGAEVDYGESALYTKDDLDEAIEQIMDRFALFGCEMHSLTYAGDEAITKKTLPG